MATGWLLKNADVRCSQEDSTRARPPAVSGVVILLPALQGSGELGLEVGRLLTGQDPSGFHHGT